MDIKNCLIEKILETDYKELVLVVLKQNLPFITKIQNEFHMSITSNKKF